MEVCLTPSSARYAMYLTRMGSDRALTIVPLNRFLQRSDVQSYFSRMVRYRISWGTGEGVGLTCGRGWKKEGRSLRDKASTAVLFVPAIMHCWDCKVGVRHVKQETAKQVSQYLVFRSSLVYHSQLRTAITSISWVPIILVIICARIVNKDKVTRYPCSTK